MNGSDATGGCPQACVQTMSTSTYCDCAGTAGAGFFTGVIIDGVVPTLDTSQRGTWATQLFTVRDNTQITTRIGFRFQNTVMLREVELYLFYCPSWNIGGSLGGTNTINIYNALVFPTFVNSFGSMGNVTLTSDMVNCECLTRVSIPLRGAISTSTYFIEFSSTVDGSTSLR